MDARRMAILQIPHHHHNHQTTLSDPNTAPEFGASFTTTTVTLGVYHEDHNDQIIPEFIQAVPAMAQALSRRHNHTQNQSPAKPYEQGDDEEDEENPPAQDNAEMTDTSEIHQDPKDTNEGGNDQSAQSTHHSSQLDQFLDRLEHGFTHPSPVLQMLATNLACWFTYALLQTHPELEPQIVTQIIVVLCGSLSPHLSTAVATGVYSGATNVTEPLWMIVVLGVFTSLTWQYVNSRKLWLGMGGRLGLTSFIAMNATILVACLVGSSDAVTWSIYWNADAWTSSTDTLVWEVILSVLASTILAAVAGLVRLRSKVPAHPVILPSAYALLFMLATYLLLTTNSNTESEASTTLYETYSILDGYAVGAYVAMSGWSYLATTAQFAQAGFVAGIWLQILRPFFGGFGGKSGTTAWLGVAFWSQIHQFWKNRKKHNTQSQTSELPR